MKQLFIACVSKNWFFALLTVTLFLAPMPAMSAGSHDACATKYPIVLAHGMGASASILGIIDYWGDIDIAMEDEGAEVYITSVNGMDSTRNKAEDFKNQFLQIKAISGADKLNVIAHSHGALYTRDAISNLGLSPYVASQTSIAGVNHGSAIADVIMGIVPDDMEWLVGDTLDFVYAYLFGDTNPNSIDNGYDLTRPYVNNTFNPNTPDMSGVYYQSWAAKIKMMAVNARNWYFLATWPILLDHEGANDGLVSIDSAKWGNFRGVEDAAFYSAGCDHLNIIGQPLGITTGFDEEEFYVELAADLKNRGY